MADSSTDVIPCSACGGSGQVIVGEHYVTSDMASDAGEPEMAGMFYGFEYGPCDRCDGAGCFPAEGGR